MFKLLRISCALLQAQTPLSSLNPPSPLLPPDPSASRLLSTVLSQVFGTEATALTDILTWDLSFLYFIFNGCVVCSHLHSMVHMGLSQHRIIHWSTQTHHLLRYCLGIRNEIVKLSRIT